MIDFKFLALVQQRRWNVFCTYIVIFNCEVLLNVRMGDRLPRSLEITQILSIKFLRFFSIFSFPRVVSKQILDWKISPFVDNLRLNWYDKNYEIQIGEKFINSYRKKFNFENILFTYSRKTKILRRLKRSMTLVIKTEIIIFSRPKANKVQKKIILHIATSALGKKIYT